MGDRRLAPTEAFVIAVAVTLVLTQLDPPAAGLWADPARSVFLTPEARSLLSGLSPASLDGLQPAASPLLFDGVRLRAPAHALWGPASLPESWLAGVGVSTASDSAEVGRTLGRSVTLLPAPQPDGFHGTLRLDTLSTGLTASTNIDRTKLQVGARFFTGAALAASLLRSRALMGDWQLRVIAPLKSGELRFLGLGVVDDLSSVVSGVPLSARLFSQLADVRWTTGAFELGLLGSHDSVALSIPATQSRQSLVGSDQGLTARAALRPHITNEITLAIGADLSLKRVVFWRSSDSVLPPIPGDAGGVVNAASRRELGPAFVGSAFFEARDTKGPFRWTAGFRGDVWKPFNARAMGSFDPRISLEREAGPQWTFVASVGVRHQTATFLVPVPVLETTSWSLGLQEALVGDLKARFEPTPKHRLEARAFASSLRRTIELSPFDSHFLAIANGSVEEAERNAGRGWASGVSVSWHFQLTPLTWLHASYSLSASYRTLTFTRLGIDGLPQGDATAEVPWAFDQAHLFQAGFGWRFENGWALSASFSAQSGAPLVGGLFSQEQRPGTDSGTRLSKWVPIDRDAVSRAPGWVRFDGRVSKKWKPAPLEFEVFLDVQNLSAWAQPTGRSYSVDRTSASAGDPMLQSTASSSPLGFPIPVLGVQARL